MKTLALLAALFLSLPAFAIADLEYLSITPEKTQVVTGERFRVTATVRNLGPDNASLPRWTLTMPGTALIHEITPPAGWRCDEARYMTFAQCTTDRFVAGATATLTLTVIAPPRADPRFLFGGQIVVAGDTNHFNNGRSTSISVIASTRTADIGVAMPSEVRIEPGADVNHRVIVSNNGPDDASNIVVVLTFNPHTPLSTTQIVASGSGWTCEMFTRVHGVCRRPTIPAGIAAPPITVRFPAPANESVETLFVSAIAELSHDPTANFQATRFYVGSAESWRRLLVSVTGHNIPGAHGSLWDTQVRMLIRSATAVEMAPTNCTFSPIPECFPAFPPLRRQFDPRAFGMIVEDALPVGQFVYVRAEDFDKVHVNGRIYDVSRAGETAGAEMPIVREDAFTSEIITLMPVPTAPEFRQTLRIYDLDGRNGTRVRIRVYANGETTPRLTTERTLNAIDGRLTTARLPAFPAAVQLDLGQLLPLAGLGSVVVEVEPVDGGTRLWAFISVTNNVTHHVTTVTPQ